MSLDMLNSLTSRFTCELESTRGQTIDDLLAVDEPVKGMDSGWLSEKDELSFYEIIRNASLACSEKMATFAGDIIAESVCWLSPKKPPCDFVALAIGSLARGEATPYSDLEYLFLVEHKSDDALQYFERLAVTNYFLIGNLGQTKLKYMAIKELKGWFDDRSKNGFKIDGLSPGAGNIPTGNELPEKSNHLSLL